MKENTKTKVYLVGAGPGHPDYLTYKAIQILKKADVVLYDKLVSEETLEIAKKAKLISVGKNSDKNDGALQSNINELLLEFAPTSKCLVRLKGGDPLVFARGGEEIQALREANIPFEIIPGISSVIAAASQLQVPLTHREISSNFCVFTGHEAEQSTGINWQLAADCDTAVFLMSYKTLPIIVTKLIEFGRYPYTPVAAISRISWQDEKQVIGELCNIRDQLRYKNLQSPMVLIIGETVGLR